MAKLPMSLHRIYDDLVKIPYGFGWNELLSLVQDELRSGRTTSRHLSYYAMRVIRRYADVQQVQEAKRAVKRDKGDPQGMSELVHAALHAQG